MDGEWTFVVDQTTFTASNLHLALSRSGASVPLTGTLSGELKFGSFELDLAACCRGEAATAAYHCRGRTWTSDPFFT